MKTKLLTALLCLLPLLTFSQNYEKEGDDLFAQAQYEQAEKKYKAAIAVQGESQTIKQKQDKCAKCNSLLKKAQTAEDESRYSDAAKYYSSLYAIHPLASYQSKSNAMQQKGKQVKTIRGTIGSNITWELYEGKLIISGEGDWGKKPYSYYKHINDIKSVIISDNVTSIGEAAFCYIGREISITIGSSVKSIGSSAFGSTGITSITIPNSVTNIGGSAFAGCNHLTSITIPNSVTNIGGGAFSGCNHLTSVYISDIASWCNISFGDYYANPLRYAKHLYLNNIEITDLVIPNGVKIISRSAFRGFTGLTSVTIPNSVTSIGNGAFEKCSNLSSITIPNSVTSIEPRAFADCSNLTSITIPNSVTSIGGYAFENCTGLTSVTIPNSITRIESGAFSDCSGLTSVTIPNSVTSIGDYAFLDCSGLTSVTIPNSVTSIGKNAFGRCEKLNIKLPERFRGKVDLSDCKSVTYY